MVGKCPRHEIGGLVADIEMHVIEAEAFDLIVDRAGHHVARGQLHTLGIVIRHETMARFGVQQMAAFAPDRFRHQEVLHIQIVKAGRVELHHFHVGNPCARAPGHRDPVTRCAAWGGAELVDPARAARRQHGRLRHMRFHLAGRLIERIGAPDAAIGGKARCVLPGDQIDAGPARQHGDVGVGLRRFQQSFLHGPAGRVVHMHDPAVGMAALARQMQVGSFRIEGHAQLHQPVDAGGARSITNSTVSRRFSPAPATIVSRM